MTKAELIKKIEEENAYALWDLPDKDWKMVACEIDGEKHRWYECSTNVYECEDGFVGVFGVCVIYGDSSPEDIDCICSACEYEPKQITTYVRKQ